MQEKSQTGQYKIEHLHIFLTFINPKQKQCHKCLIKRNMRFKIPHLLINESSNVFQQLSANMLRKFTIF